MKLITDFGGLNVLEYEKLIRNELDSILMLEDKYFKLIELNSFLSLLYGQYNYLTMNNNDSILMELLSDYILNANFTKDSNNFTSETLKQNFRNVLNEKQFIEFSQTYPKRKELAKVITNLYKEIDNIKQDILNPTTDLKLIKSGTKWLFNGNINTLCFMLYEVNQFQLFEVKKTFINAICEHYLVKKNDTPTELNKKSVTTYYNRINKEPKHHKTPLEKESRLFIDLKSSLETISEKYIVK